MLLVSLPACTVHFCRLVEGSSAAARSRPDFSLSPLLQPAIVVACGDKFWTCLNAYVVWHTDMRQQLCNSTSRSVMEHEFTYRSIDCKRAVGLDMSWCVSRTLTQPKWFGTSKCQGWCHQVQQSLSCGTIATISSSI
eukprot:SAG31_NODE_8604_length_1422_cov_0.683296_1_plen_137_part_00